MIVTLTACTCRATYDVVKGFDGIHTVTNSYSRTLAATDAWQQFKLDGTYTDIVAVWAWARPDASFTEFKNVTVIVSADMTPFSAGTVCTTGLTATSATQGPMQVSCPGAAGTSVQYVTLQQYVATATSFSVSIHMHVHVGVGPSFLHQSAHNVGRTGALACKMACMWMSPSPVRPISTRLQFVPRLVPLGARGLSQLHAMPSGCVNGPRACTCA